VGLIPVSIDILIALVVGMVVGAVLVWMFKKPTMKEVQAFIFALEYSLKKYDDDMTIREFFILVLKTVRLIEVDTKSVEKLLEKEEEKLRKEEEVLD